MDEIAEARKWASFGRRGHPSSEAGQRTGVENLPWRELVSKEEARRKCEHMTSVVRGKGESFEGLLRRFKKAVQRDRILSLCRRKRFYEKPSAKRKRKAAKKLRKSRQTTLKQQRRRW